MHRPGGVRSRILTPPSAKVTPPSSEGDTTIREDDTTISRRWRHLPPKVTPPSPESDTTITMPAHPKDLTHRTSLRYTDDEDTTISNTVRAYAEVGITLSRNDAVRVLIRRAAVPLPESERIARRRWTDHVRMANCACTMERPACADGWWLTDMWGALVAAEQARTASTPQHDPEKTPRRTVTSPRTRMEGATT